MRDETPLEVGSVIVAAVILGGRPCYSIRQPKYLIRLAGRRMIDRAIDLVPLSVARSSSFYRPSTRGRETL